MTIDITYDEAGLHVEGDNLITMPEPGIRCPECDAPTRWVQGLMSSHALAAYVLPLCGHEFSARQWELLCRGEEWSLTPRVLSRYSWADDRLWAWEDTINETFRRLGSLERVCAHLNQTGTDYGTGARLVECDFCPASGYSPSPDIEARLVPHYYVDAP